MGRKSKADVRKKEILEHFYQVLIADGFENSSIANIAKRMDVNPSLLIHYFKTKEEMVVDLVDFILIRFEEMFMMLLENVQAPKDRFEVILNMMFGVEWTSVIDHSVFYVCYYLSSRNPRILERFRAMYDRFELFLLDESAVWIKEGIVNVTLSPREITEYLVLLNEGMTYYEGIRQDPKAYAERGKLIKNLVLQTLQPRA